MNAAAQNWKAAREAAGLSALQAAELIEVHRNTIYDLENPEKDGVTLRIMKRAASVYGVTLGEIFREDDDSGRAPRELQPLAEVLSPLPMADRESVVRNIVANLRFMVRIAGGGVGKPASFDTPVRAQNHDQRPGNVGSGYVVEVPGEPIADKGHASDNASQVTQQVQRATRGGKR